MPNDIRVERYGAGTSLVAVILDGTECHDWRDPLDNAAIMLSLGNEQRCFDDEGLLDNVGHKLRWVLRTGLDSSEARQRPDLLEPGDFPHAGAGTYRGYTGGVSGLLEESDWWVFCRIVDQLIRIRTLAAMPAAEASASHVLGMKYLGQRDTWATPDNGGSAAPVLVDLEKRVHNTGIIGGLIPSAPRP